MNPEEFNYLHQNILPTMKILITFSCLSFLLFSCGPPTTSQTEKEVLSDSTIAVFKTRWNIPLTEFWKNEAQFILVVPNDYGVDLMKNSTPQKMDDLLTDTIQGKILDRAVEPLLNNGCEPMRSLQVELGIDPKRAGWVRAEDVYEILELDAATFTHGDKTFKVGLMNPWYRQSDGYCYFATLIFLYDDQYLYLIDAEGGDSDVRWENANHLSIVNTIGGLALSSRQQGDSWILTWGEPNVKKELTLFWTGDHVKFQSLTTTPQNDVDDINPDAGIDLEAESVTVVCTLQYIGLGDCPHREFDCGDFGMAQTNLSEAENKLWSDLALDKDDELTANPKYVGKKFEITYRIIMAEGCGDPGEDHSRDEVQVVTGFKLKE